MICNGCGGKGERVPFFMTRVLPCSECRGKGVVPDFAYVMALVDGKPSYRIGGGDHEPMRFTVDGARREAKTMRNLNKVWSRSHGRMVDVEAIAIIRVYEK